MNIEIEKRYIIKNDKWKKYIKAKSHIKQAYFELKDNNLSTRVRITDLKFAEITIKKRISQTKRLEFEYTIPLNDGKRLYDLLNIKINKERYFLNFNNEKWVVDCFYDKNYPLVIAEIEIESNSNILKPYWCEKEISDITELTNSSLANDPIQEWDQVALSKILES